MAKKEKWEPFPKEIQKTEAMMTEEQKKATQERRQKYPIQTMGAEMKRVFREQDTPVKALGFPEEILSKLKKIKVKNVGLPRASARLFRDGYGGPDFFPFNEDEIKLMSDVMAEKGFNPL